MNDIYQDIVNNTSRYVIDDHKSNHLGKLGRAINHGGQLSPELMYLITMLLRHPTYYPPESLYSLADALYDFGMIKDAKTNDINWSFNLTYQGKRIAKRICPRYQCTSTIIWLLNLLLFKIPIMLIVIICATAYVYMIHTLPVSNVVWGILMYFGMLVIIYTLLILIEWFSKVHFISVAKWINNSDPALIYKIIIDSPRWHLLNKPILKILFQSVDAFVRYGLVSKETLE